MHRLYGQSISLTNHEAREVFRRTHILVEKQWVTRWRQGQAFVGWLDFNHHIFYFRDDEADFEIMHYLFEEGCTIFPQIQHMILNPGGRGLLWSIMQAIMSHCDSLRTLVVVAPWIPEPEWNNPDYLARYEDWGQVFRKSPKELDVSWLIKAIEGSEKPSKTGCDAWQQEKIKQMVQDFPGGRPRLLILRWRHDVKP